MSYILVVDNELDQVSAVIETLREFRITCIPAYDGLSALDIIQEGPKGIVGVFTDLDLSKGGINGLEVIVFARVRKPGLPAALVTAQRPPDGFPSTEYDFYIEKPTDLETVRETAREMLRLGGVF